MSAVLVTGATGFVGRHLIRRLRRQKDDVVVYARSTSDTREARKLGCRVATGDLRDFARVREAVKTADRVIHVGEIGMRVKNSRRRNVELVETLIDAAAPMENFKRIVFVSSVTVVAPPVKSPADEITPGKTTIRDNYTIYKRECEKALLAGKAPATIIRGSAIYGPGAHYLLWFAKWLRRAGALGLPFPGRCDAKLSFIHVADMAAALAAAAGQTEKDVKIYNASDGVGCSAGEFVSLLAREMNMRFRLRQLPLSWQRLFASGVDGVLSIFGMPPNAKAILDFLSHDGLYSNEKMIRELGIELAYPSPADGLPETAAWISANWR